MNRTYRGNHFFVLSKGNNAGRPMDKPCPNCFVIITKCPHEKQLLYWLCSALWQCGYFKPHLCGSVIPFLRLPELKTIIRNTHIRIENRKAAYEKAVDTLNKLLAVQKKLSNQLHLIHETKKKVLWQFLRV
ncbi:MAG: hypothetical protein KF803_02570 [Cyclobacteriaceae bacterium]|nr:hypothetical protein [Cyclobacteriaceae bacterium]